MLIATSFATPFGCLAIEFDEHYIYRALFTDTPLPPQPDTPQSQLIQSELNNYISNSHHPFQLPLKPQGTLYQQRVWKALLEIPAGFTMTYGELSKALQSSPRAIGQACKKNPIALFIPCHRIVGQTTHGGYMGRADALGYKIGLLHHEKS